MEFPAKLSQQQQPEGVAPSGNVSKASDREPTLETSNKKPVSELPNSSSVIQLESTSVRATRSGGVVSVSAPPEPAVPVTTTRSGRVVRKPLKHES